MIGGVSKEEFDKFDDPLLEFLKVIQLEKYREELDTSFVEYADFNFLNEDDVTTAFSDKKDLKKFMEAVMKITGRDKKTVERKKKNEEVEVSKKKVDKKDSTPTKKKESEKNAKEKDSCEIVKVSSKEVEVKKTGVVMYDFDSDDKEEISVKEGEKLTILSSLDELWFLCKNSQGEDGYVPKTYIEIQE